MILTRKSIKSDRSAQLDYFLLAFSVVPITDSLDLCAKEKIRLRLAGTPADDDFDLLIGCTAVAMNLTLVTENVRHFKNIKSIKLENWVERT